MQVTERWSSQHTTPLPAAALRHILRVAKRNTRLRGASDPSAPRPSAADGAPAFSSSEDFSDANVASGKRERHAVHRHRSWPAEGIARGQQQLQRTLHASRERIQSWSHALRGRMRAHSRGFDGSQRDISSNGCTKVSLSDVPSFQLPNQENRLALVMDPFTDHVPFTFGVEIFPPGHKTNAHVHNTAHEMFFIVSGSGEAFCNGARFKVAAGDTVVFPPGCVHGIDADEHHKLYCLELMLPNEQFSEFVRAGQRLEGLGDDDMCVMAAIGCQ